MPSPLTPRQSLLVGLFSRCPQLTLAVALWLPLIASSQPVIISEFMAANSGSLSGPGGTHDDWIELQNLSSHTVNLAGWVLSNSPKEKRGWPFPSTNLAPSSQLVVWASGRNLSRPGAPLHTDFRLSSSGKYLALRRPDGAVSSEFAPAYPRQFADVSYGRIKGLSNATHLAIPTPGAPNESAARLPGPALETAGSAHSILKPAAPLRVQFRANPQLAHVRQSTLWWRTAFRRETNSPMTLGPDELWTAEIPAKVLKGEAFVRWRVTSEDTEGRSSSLPFYGNAEHSSR